MIQIRDAIGQDDVSFQQAQTPALIALRRLGTGQGNDLGLDLAGDNRLNRRGASLLALDRSRHITTTIGIDLRDVHNGRHTNPDPFSDHRVSRHSTIAVGVVLIEFQQDPCPTDC